LGNTDFDYTYHMGSQKPSNLTILYGVKYSNKINHSLQEL